MKEYYSTFSTNNNVNLTKGNKLRRESSSGATTTGNDGGSKSHRSTATTAKSSGDCTSTTTATESVWERLYRNGREDGITPLISNKRRSRFRTSVSPTATSFGSTTASRNSCNSDRIEEMYQQGVSKLRSRPSSDDEERKIRDRRREERELVLASSEQRPLSSYNNRTTTATANDALRPKAQVTSKPKKATMATIRKSNRLVMEPNNTKRRNHRRRVEQQQPHQMRAAGVAVADATDRNRTTATTKKSRISSSPPSAVGRRSEKENREPSPPSTRQSLSQATDPMCSPPPVPPFPKEIVVYASAPTKRIEVKTVSVARIDDARNNKNSSNDDEREWLQRQRQYYRSRHCKNAAANNSIDPPLDGKRPATAPSLRIVATTAQDFRTTSRGGGQKEEWLVLQQAGNLFLEDDDDDDSLECGGFTNEDWSSSGNTGSKSVVDGDVGIGHRSDDDSRHQKRQQFIGGTTATCRTQQTEYGSI